MLPMLLVAAAWLVLLLSAPALPAAASAIVYAAGSLICHQRPERSFHVDVYQLPVCARCLGIYAGAAAGCLAGVLLRRRRAGETGSRSATSRNRVLTALALVPTAVTVAFEWAHVWYPSNVTRALAGATAGYVVALVVTRTLATVHYGEWAPRPPTAPNPPRSPI